MISEENIQEFVGGFVVRKDLSKLVKGNALVPTYVLEYLLGQYCATKDETTIEKGIETVKEILAKHYVNRSENQLVLSWIKERGHYKIIDRVTVALNDARGTYEATFANSESSVLSLSLTISRISRNSSSEVCGASSI